MPRRHMANCIATTVCHIFSNASLCAHILISNYTVALTLCWTEWSAWENVDACRNYHVSEDIVAPLGWSCIASQNAEPQPRVVLM